MPTPNPVNDMYAVNQYGEDLILDIKTIAQATSQLAPAKTGVTALSALAGGATLSDVITQLNALLAAMKAVV